MSISVHYMPLENVLSFTEKAYQFLWYMCIYWQFRVRLVGVFTNISYVTGTTCSCSDLPEGGISVKESRRIRYEVCRNRRLEAFNVKCLVKHRI